MTYVPYNAATGKAYNEGNILILTDSAKKLNGLNDPRWLTFLQAQELGFRVKKGSKSTRIAFVSEKKVEPNEKGEISSKDLNARKIVRHFNVFHASQIEGIPPLASAFQGEE